MSITDVHTSDQALWRDQDETTVTGLTTTVPNARPVDLGEPTLSRDHARTREQRMERVLDVVEEVGFENMDVAVTEYYTAIFKNDTLPHWAQSTSRRRRLHKFLSELHESAEGWGEGDLQRYNEERMRFAEDRYIHELRRLERSGTPGNNIALDRRALLAGDIRYLFSDDSVSRLVKRDRQSLRERVSALRA